MWEEVTTAASELLPDFNDQLLLHARQDGFPKIKECLHQALIETCRLCESSGKLSYRGYHVLNPQERIEYLRCRKRHSKGISILKSSFEIVAYHICFEQTDYPIYIPIPYLEHQAVWLKDSPYYPKFMEIEKGSRRCAHNEITIKVMRAHLKFARDATFSVTTMEGQRLTEVIITAKILQRKLLRRQELPPIILYSLCHAPLTDVLRQYGFAEDEFLLERSYTPQAGYSSIKLAEGLYLRIKNTVLHHIIKRRFVVAYAAIINHFPQFPDMEYLYRFNQTYYISALGNYCYPESEHVQLMYDNARDHLASTDVMLDRYSQQSLANIGVVVNDIYDIFPIIFTHLDEWLCEYNVLDLFSKKIADFSQSMAPTQENIIARHYDIINNKSEKLTNKAVSTFTSRASCNEDLTARGMYTPNPTFYNDNWLLACGTKRQRSTANIETSVKQMRSSIPKKALLAHYSTMVVESILALPSSNPIIAGEINPMAQIDADNGFIKPDYAIGLEHIYD